MTTAPTAAEEQRGRPRLFGGLAGGERKLAIWIGVVALIGVGIATYLVYVHYAGIKPICAAGNGGCEKVQTSDYSKLAGIPVADLGLAGYLAILASLFVRGDLGRLAGAAIALSGFGFSVYLTYREIFTIKAICQWCVGSAVLMTLLAILTTWRLLKAEPG
ncbi:MAG TPA: vitamin K epoxide reductase family protein [Thermoleophilaceae bacterium]